MAVLLLCGASVVGIAMTTTELDFHLTQFCDLEKVALGVREALSSLLVCCAKMHGVAMFHAAAVMASHLSIAAARNCRIVLREIR